jgi:hypothetical protein
LPGFAGLAMIFWQLRKKLSVATDGFGCHADRMAGWAVTGFD